jgi:methionyl-tRNA formyltransferase
MKLQKNNIEIFQPFNIREDNDWLVNKNPDLIVTCAYGQIVPQKVLDIPRLGCINVHGSLLPSLRGAAPIQYAILNDLKVTGVTIMQMVKKMDAGDMFAKREVEVTNFDTGDSLFKKMEVVACDLLIDMLPDYIDGNLKGEVQDESKVTFAPSIKREEELINWNDKRRNIYNKIRALNSVPGAYALLDDLSIKIYDSEEISKVYDGECGEIVEVSKDSIIVKVNDGAIAIKEIQPSGKKRMLVRDFINGNKNLKGKKFHD